MGRATKADLQQEIEQLRAQLAALQREEGEIVVKNVHEAHVTISRIRPEGRREECCLSPHEARRLPADWLKEMSLRRALDEKWLIVVGDETEGVNIFAIMENVPEDVTIPLSPFAKNFAMQIALYPGDEIKRGAPTEGLEQRGRADMLLDYLELKPLRTTSRDRRIISPDWLKSSFLEVLKYARYLEGRIQKRPKILELLDFHIKRVQDLPLTY